MDPVYWALVALLAGGVGADVMFGKTMRWRKPLQAGLVLLAVFLLLAANVPRTSDAPAPDLPATSHPY
jgi:hypothetical protein